MRARTAAVALLAAASCARQPPPEPAPRVAAARPVPPPDAGPPTVTVRTVDIARVELLAPPPDAPCPCPEELVGRGQALTRRGCSCAEAFPALAARTGDAPRVLASLQPDASGAVRLPAPTSKVLLALHGKAGAVAYYAFEPGEPLDLEPLRAAPAHRAKLVDGAGKAVRDAHVLAVCDDAAMVGVAHPDGDGFAVPFRCGQFEPVLWVRTARGAMAVDPMIGGDEERRIIVGGAGSLTVKVTRAGKPVPGAAVMLAGSPRVRALTGATGTATFSGLSDASYPLRAAKDGLAADAVAQLSDDGNRPFRGAARMSLELAPPLEVSGVVRAAPDGGPLAGARVSAESAFLAPETTTDDAGRYHLLVTPERDTDFERKPIWTATVHATAPGYLEDHDFTQAEPGAKQTLDLAVWKSVQVTGRVVDEHGQPVANAHVAIYLADARPHRLHLTDRFPDGEAHTQPDGTFALRGIHAGLPQGRSANLVISDRDHPYFQKQLAVDARPIDAQLAPGTGLEVVIRDPDGGRVSTGCLELDGNGCYWADDGGVFRGGWHEPGPVELKLVYSGYEGEPAARTTLEVGKVQHLELRAGPRRAPIRVTVVDRAGKPVAGEEVSLGEVGDAFPPMRETTDEKGEVLFDRVSWPRCVVKLDGDRAPSRVAAPGDAVRLVAP